MSERSEEADDVIRRESDLDDLMKTSVRAEVRITVEMEDNPDYVKEVIDKFKPDHRWKVEVVDIETEVD